MTKRLLASALSASLLLAAGCGSAAERPSAELVAIGDSLKGPAGLTATTYGQGPATVAAATFDSQGRLWLTAAGLSSHKYDGVYVIARRGGSAVTSALVAEWATSEVLRVSLAMTGSTYTGTVTPFLTGMKNPLALALTPDRSLLVGDWTTGRIYRLSSS